MITIPQIQKKKKVGEKISMLTAYDAPFASIFDEAGVDILLVGDSLGRVVQGHENTLPVTLEQMIYHTQCVGRGTKHALIVSDMPFLSYQVSSEQAIQNTGRILKETPARAVKLEGGRELEGTVRTLTQIGIPVMGHIGLQPQSIHTLGTYKMQGKTIPQAEALKETALLLQAAGCFSLVLECVTAETAEEITKALEIPTIGIGAGPHCDGQVLVLHDMLGLLPEARLKHAKIYTHLYPMISQAAKEYVSEVQSGKFPSEEQTTHRISPLEEIAVRKI